MRRLVAAFARNLVFANILLVTIVFSGFVGTQMMVREMFPQMSLDILLVTVPYPGADPAEVEEGISRKIEEGIEGIEGIKRYTTHSSENASVCVVECKEDYDVVLIKERVRNAIDSISTFPLDSEPPIIQELAHQSEVMFLALWGDLPDKTIKEEAERIKDELQALPELSVVQIFGANEYEIAIELSKERLRKYGLTFDQVAGLIRANNLNFPGGVVRGKGEEFRLRTLERKYTGKEFADIVLLSGPQGEIVTLDRVATIKDGFVEDSVMTEFNGKPCVLLRLLNTPEEDAIVISAAIRKWAEQKEKQLPEGVNISVMTDMSRFIQARIRLLVRNGLIGLTLVFILLWLFLDWRLSFWAAMGIPISLAGALAIMMVWGHSINMINLFGLIMVLGIIVDDAIVVGEAIFVHRKNGAPPLVAAVNGVCEVGLPVVAAVTTTIVAFIPMLFVGGIMGKFIAVLPIAVMGALAISLIECLILLPAHLNHLPDPNAKIDEGRPWKRRARKTRRGISHGMEWFVEHMYMPFVEKVVRWRYISVAVAITVLLLTIGIWQGGIIKYEMFPTMDGDQLTATVVFPEGTPLETSMAAVELMRDSLDRVAARHPSNTGDTIIANTFAMKGASIPDRDFGRFGPQYGAVRAELIDATDRSIHSKDIAVEWEEEIGKIPGAISLSIMGMQTGPPGASLEIWAQGEDMTQILAASNETLEELRKLEGLYQLRSDYRPGKRELRFKLKPEARSLGLTVADLARQVRAGYYGEEAMRIQRGRNDIRVKVRYTAAERRDLAELDEVRIRTPQGFDVPLLSVADVTFADGYSTIIRTNGFRRVAVKTEVNADIANTQEVLDELHASFFPGLLERYPGISIAIEGSQKENSQALGSLRVGFPLALLGIFVIIATIFRSYVQPFVIMATVPFGVVGAIYGHLIMGFVKGGRYDLTMMSIFGIVALAGVVVNDAIVLIECINNMIADGVPFFEAIKRGGARRFRAIFLTTVSTVGGLMPMIVERDMQAQFLIPMAVSIAAGVAFATLLTLLLIPSLLGVVNDLRRVAHYARYRRWPTPEEVEPAIDRKVDVFAEESKRATPVVPVAK